MYYTSFIAVSQDCTLTQQEERCEEAQVASFFESVASHESDLVRSAWEKLIKNGITPSAIPRIPEEVLRHDADIDHFRLGSFVNMVLDIGHQGMRDEAIKFIEETSASVSLMFAKGSGSTFYTFKKLVGFSDVEAMVEKLVGHIVVLKVRVARSKAGLPI
ncbi:hypothetical protein CEUSTIGMA_g13993.t1 [Chlamydomonas eustigma]|uniref:Uncharacterized protein n=1 Tax=Chlamydomonas eustigma TaxID=1157962 RepID=A0A250XU35_9CHLO|nr:hypothetical protein CEUSTIGMA_g13993.t1 [Chlamydomonas eustigma]|eukprot:GAX86585.1 hypothetical protein CEUSTIGMA_g13993.t1 [Chlamydomonas eustigma]